MIRRLLVVMLFLAILVCGYGLVRITPTFNVLPIEVPPTENETGAGAGVTGQGEGATTIPESVAPAEPTPTPGPTATPSAFLSGLSTGPPVVIKPDDIGNVLVQNNGVELQTRRLPRHGLIIAFILPLMLFGVPWLILEFFIIRYVQPRGVDLTTILIKAQDGLFVEAVVSMTARRTLTLASTRMTWPRVQGFVEKSIEQELIHEASNFPSLDDLERNLKSITENLLRLSLINELKRDFGLDVIRFNIEPRYTPGTMEALQRKAEASAGGTAYLAYAAAAHLDPDQIASRELYKVYQETTSQVDAARNLGGGIATFLSAMRQQEEKDKRERRIEEDVNDE